MNGFHIFLDSGYGYTFSRDAMRIITILSAIVLCLTAAVPGAVAAAPVAVTDSFSRAQVGGSLEILEDSDGRLAFGEVSSGSVEKRFTGGHGEAPNFGYTRSVYWARFALSDTRASRQELFLEFNYTHLDVIDIYWRDANGAVVAKKIGKRFPYATREVKYRNPVAVIPPDAATPQTVYMRIDTGSSMQLAATLWTPRAFAEAVRHEQYVFGLFYGTMIVMAIYNLFLFFFVRDRNYLYYVLYIFAYVLVQISFNGLAFEYLWPGQVWWNGRCIPFFIGFSSLCIIQFARSFLGAKTTVPSMHRALQVLLVYAALVMAVSLAGPYQLAMKLGLVLMIVETVVISITGSAHSKLGIASNIVMELVQPRDDQKKRNAPLGTIFELSSMVMMDSMVPLLMAKLNQDEASLRRRHAIWV